jgi:HrpA-like RNA helicase
MMGNCWWLASVIASHDRGRVVGRDRLQQAVLLLQSAGLPTDYRFSSFFRGPHSEGVMSDLRLLERLGLVSEQGAGPGLAYVASPRVASVMQEMGPFLEALRALEQSDLASLEAAARIGLYVAAGDTLEDAVSRAALARGGAPSQARISAALSLLRRLGVVEEGPPLVGSGAPQYRSPAVSRMFSD